MIDIDETGVFLGLDVGKSNHHGHGLTPAGKKVFDKALPNGEPQLRAVFDKLKAKFGTVLVVVDQPASIGALPLTVARDTGCQVAYLPGVAYLGITNGHDFIEDDFFAFMYCVASVQFAFVPLLAWRRNGSWYADPGFGRTTWLPWLFMTGQGVAYSAQRTDSNIFLLIGGWAGFMGAGVVAIYYLGNAFWLNAQRATHDTDKAAVGERAEQPESREPEAGA